MQTLWNRIVQTKRARKYSSCFSSAAACTRRTATAAFRNRLSSRDRFTVLYSSFLTAATVIDSEIKRDKREKLLGAITEAKDELKALDTSQKLRLAALSVSSEDTKRTALRGRRTWLEVLKGADQEKRARNALGLDDWKGVPLHILEGFSISQLEDAFRNNSVLRKRLSGADSRAFTMPVCSVKKQKIMEWSTAKLAYRILQRIYQCNVSPDDSSPGLGNVPRALDEIIRVLVGDAMEADVHLTKIRTLPPHSDEIKTFLSPNAPRYTLDRHNMDKAATLNSSLHEVFQFSQTQKSELRFLISNICRHLLASNAPPIVQTYTLLASNFEKLGEHALVKAVMDAVAECRIRLDEEALTFWLNYYATTDNIEEFRKLVSRMEGFGHRLGPAHVNNIAPGIAFDQYQFGDCESTPSKNPSAYEDSTASDNEFFAPRYRNLELTVFRASRKNQDVYGSLIRGTLKLLGDEKAMDSYIDMISKGYEPTVEILTSILDRLCNTDDWRSALRVVQKIDAIAGTSLQTCRWALQLCQNDQDDGRFKCAVKSGIRCGVLSPAVQYFPEEIEAMQTNRLIDLASAYDDCVQRAEGKNTISRSPERLARWLGVIGHQMAETAFKFGILTLRAGHSPTKGFFLYTRIKYHRAELLGWAERGENQTSPFSHNVLSISSATPGALNDAPSGRYEVLDRFEVPGFPDTTPSSIYQVHTRARGKGRSLWDPLLKMLARDFQDLGLLLGTLAQEVSDIELSIRHRPTVRRVLTTKWLRATKRADLTPEEVNDIMPSIRHRPTVQRELSTKMLHERKCADLTPQKGLLLSKVAQEVSDIELSIRHRPPVQRVLSTKMLRARKCADLTPQTPSEQKHKWSKEKQSAHLTRQDTKSSMPSPEGLASQGKFSNGERCLIEWNQYSELSSEIRWDPPGP